MKCERTGCGKQAVWDWKPRMMYLCDDHAADVDLAELDDLIGVKAPEEGSRNA